MASKTKEEWKIIFAETQAHTLNRRIDRNACLAKLWHGPGHQSGTFCEGELGHTGEHFCIYGSYEEEARWLNEKIEEHTGFFDEPPQGD